MNKTKFTEFEKGTNWCSGVSGDYKFSAKLFDVGSSFGINHGRVSKLSITDKDGNWLVNYDRGWDIRPDNKVSKAYYDIMELLETAPKRF